LLRRRRDARGHLDLSRITLTDAITLRRDRFVDKLRGAKKSGKRGLNYMQPHQPETLAA
jgi:hypothetical protein